MGDYVEQLYIWNFSLQSKKKYSSEISLKNLEVYYPKQSTYYKYGFPYS